MNDWADGDLYDRIDELRDEKAALTAEVERLTTERNAALSELADYQQAVIDGTTRVELGNRDGDLGTIRSQDCYGETAEQRAPLMRRTVTTAEWSEVGDAS